MSEPSHVGASPHPLVIVGAGGFALEVLWVATRISQNSDVPVWNVLGFVDDQSNLRGHLIEGLPVLGSVKEFLEIYQGRPIYFHCAIGNNRRRQALAENFEDRGFLPATLIDPQAVISPRAEVGPGCYLAPRVYVGPAVKLGRHVLVNVAASLGHQCMMEDYTQACPGVRLSGQCVVEKLAFLGSNAVVHPGKHIGAGATVGASSFVVRNVKAGTLALGVPATTVFSAGAANEAANTTEAPE